MNIKKRKTAHIKLVNKAQTPVSKLDNRFNYEPLLANHVEKYSYNFLGEEIGAPIFLSSITGGTNKSRKINNNISIASNELNLPMGLGSIRPLLDNPNDNSFIMGNKLTFANIGIAQLYRWEEINRVINKLKLFGLIIHINPLQEWCQPDGDVYKKTPLEILNKYLGKIESKIIIKEVGCGFGPKSIKALLELPINVLDLSGYGGTNFTKMELLRQSKKIRDFYAPLNSIGVSNKSMINYINKYIDNGIGLDKSFIVSGGIQNFLDGYYYNSLLNSSSIYGYAGKILKHAIKKADYLIDFLRMEIQGYNLSRSYLTIK